MKFLISNCQRETTCFKKWNIKTYTCKAFHIQRDYGKHCPRLLLMRSDIGISIWYGQWKIQEHPVPVTQIRWVNVFTLDNQVLWTHLFHYESSHILSPDTKKRNLRNQTWMVSDGKPNAHWHMTHGPIFQLNYTSEKCCK